MSNNFKEIHTINDIQTVMFPSIAISYTTNVQDLISKGLDIFEKVEDGIGDPIISYEKLSKYIKPVLVLRHRFEDHEKHYKSKFK